MAYLRGNYYVWNDGNRMHLWVYASEDAAYDWATDCDYAAGVAIPNDVFDALALMRVAEIDASRNRKKYERRAIERFGGNFGSAALYKRLGMIAPWRKKDNVTQVELSDA